MKEYVLKLKGFDMFIGGGSGKIVFDKYKALCFNDSGQAKAWFNVIKESVPQLGKFNDYECIRK